MDRPDWRVMHRLGPLFENQMSPWLSAESYWIPSHLVDSAWLQHGAFASWLVAHLRPRTIVELGTHNGYSFFAFCEAASRLGLPTQCFALDTWRGDDHAGFYDEHIFQLVSEVSEVQYPSTSTLIRGFFDDALDLFEPESIDLLHIDGRHGFEDAKHDFESWKTKLSERAVVLFHDIAEHENGFEVWMLWQELSEIYPSFSFQFGHGLGVLAVGQSVPDELQTFLQADEATTNAIQADYEALGGRIFGIFALLKESALLKNDLHSSEMRANDAIVEVAALRDSLSWRSTRPLRWLSSKFPSRFRAGAKSLLP